MLVLQFYIKKGYTHTKKSKKKKKGKRKKKERKKEREKKGDTKAYCNVNRSLYTPSQNIN